MIRQILLSAILLSSSLMTWATRPIRTIVVRQADGSLVSMPFGHSKDGKIHEACCSYHQEKKATRALMAPTADGLGQYGLRGKGILNSLGDHKIPVIMVEFQDVEFQPENTALRVDSLFNHEGFAQTSDARGCVRDYFVDQSYNLFRPQFFVVGKFKAKRERAYYGANAGTSKNIRARELYSEMTAAAVNAHVDFTPFLEDGTVPLVVLFFAGPGEHNSFETGHEDYLWAHFFETATQTGGVKFNSYFMGNELFNIYKREGKSYALDTSGNPIVESTRLDGIGVLCHELSHALGLTDTYSTYQETDVVYKTPDFFDLMDYGQWGASGFRPVGYSAYQRSVLGWLSIEELKANAGQKTLEQLHKPSEATAPQAYLLRNPIQETEYIILENRQDSKWFDVRFGHGMLAYHVDYKEEDWRANRPNNDANNLRYVVIPADGQWQNNRNAGGYAPYRSDFFPGTNQVTEFSADNSPFVAWKNGAFQSPLFNITETSDGRITFDYLEKTPNAISSAPTKTVPTMTYTLDGRQIHSEHLPAGVYLRDGKKIIVR